MAPDREQRPWLVKRFGKSAMSERIFIQFFDVSTRESMKLKVFFAGRPALAVGSRQDSSAKRRITGDDVGRSAPPGWAACNDRFDAKPKGARKISNNR